MNILNAKQTKAADKYTMLQEEISSFELMEIAGNQLFNAIKAKHSSLNEFIVFCGPGNNGGDGLVIAHLLNNNGYKVFIYILKGNYTKEFTDNLTLIKENNINYIELDNSAQIKQIQVNENAVLIDALYGIGITRSLDGKAAELVTKINQLKNHKLSIDIPSGLSPDYVFSSTEKNCIKANETLTVQLPKLAFFFPENYQFVGNWSCVNIGIPEDFIKEQNCQFSFSTLNEIKQILKPRHPFGHKGTFGHGLVIAGSNGKYGAAILSSVATLKTGCGLVSAMVPDEMVFSLLSYAPEIMTINRQKTSQKNFHEYDAIAFGPGVGIDLINSQLLEQLVQNYTKPLIIDADGLTILSNNRHLYDILKPNILLTPHPGEFDRLTHKHADTFDRIQTQIRFSKKYNVNILLKGRYSSITNSKGQVWFNTSGNCGMATAGSGDVLTGIVTSLCAQGYEINDAAKLGAYIHGYSGDIAANCYSKHSLVASDITKHISDFFKNFENN